MQEFIEVRGERDPARLLGHLPLSSSEADRVRECFERVGRAAQVVIAYHTSPAVHTYRHGCQRLEELLREPERAEFLVHRAPHPGLDGWWYYLTATPEQAQMLGARWGFRPATRGA